MGETLSSGTGAAGAAVAYRQERAGTSPGEPVSVVLEGGELEVEVGRTCAYIFQDGLYPYTRAG